MFFCNTYVYSKRNLLWKYMCKMKNTCKNFPKYMCFGSKWTHVFFHTCDFFYTCENKKHVFIWNQNTCVSYENTHVKEKHVCFLWKYTCKNTHVKIFRNTRSKWTNVFNFYMWNFFTHVFLKKNMCCIFVRAKGCGSLNIKPNKGVAPLMSIHRSHVSI